MEHFPIQRTPAEWALEWLWDQPEVSVVLSGMSAMAQVEENVRCAEASRIHTFSRTEQALIADVQKRYSARTAIPCTKCNYCMPCPNGVNIPGNFAFFNYAHAFDDVAGARFKYSVFLTEGTRSGSCIDLRGALSAEDPHCGVDAQGVCAAGLTDSAISGFIIPRIRELQAWNPCRKLVS
jgi:predicted aldo/keto reductase-like oxidoreductase